MQNPNSNNQNNPALRFLEAHARRTGRPLEALLKSLGVTIAGSMGEHLGTDATASLGLSVGPSSSLPDYPLSVTLQSSSALQKYRQKEHSERAKSKFLETFGLDPGAGDTTTRLARLFVDLAWDVAVRRYGVHVQALGQVVLLLPQELLAAHLGRSPRMLAYALKALEQLGFIARRGWATTLDGQTRRAGTLIAVRLKPGRARLYREDYAHNWRDLDADRREGRTAWAWMQAGQRPDYDTLLSWALGKPVAPGEAVPDVQLYDILGLSGMLPHEAAPVVTQLADYLATRLNDHHSRAFYAKLLWRVVYLELKPEVLITQIERVLAEAREGWARKPGALLASRLKA